MHPALSTLMKLQWRGTLRRMLRGIKTLRGGTFFGVGLVVFLLWLFPNIFMAVSRGRTDPEKVRAITPLFLLAACILSVVTSSGEKAVYFTPGEVDFLFPGPFTRRELLVYKLGKSAIGAMVTSLIFSVVFLKHATWWIAAYFGILTSLLFVQLFSTSFMLLGQTVAERAYTRSRKLVLFAVATLAAVGIGQALAAGGESDWVSLTRRFQESWPGYCLLLPFDVFGRTISAEHLFPDLLIWSVLALVLDLALFAFVMRLDANYLEAALVSSQRIYERLQRARRGGSMTAWGAKKTAGWRVPQLPWLGGSGPIVWRQLTNLLRNSRGLIWLLFLLAISIGPMLVTSATESKQTGSLIGGVVWMSIFIPMVFRFDFRSELDHMDWLKMLPLRPTSIALGELLPPALITSVVQALLFGGIALFVEGLGSVLLAASLFALPFNLFLFGVENMLFLMFPSRMTPTTPGDFQFFGRNMVLFLAKMLVLMPCLGATAALGWLAYWLSGSSWIAFAVASWLVLAIEAVAILPCVAWAYLRFDPSTDTPA